MKQNKRSNPESRPSCTSARSSKPTGKSAVVVGAGEGRRLEQVSFRVRPELKSAILDEARRRRLTVQTFILLALRNEGVSVLNSDLEDLRQGTPRQARTTESMRSDRPAARSGALEAPLYPGDLNLLVTLLSAIARPGGAQPANIVVTTTCGCRAMTNPSGRNLTNSTQTERTDYVSKTTGIEWTDTTWNPIAGCFVASPGCKNCYAVEAAWRMMHHPNEKVAGKYAGMVEKNANGAKCWTGEVRLIERTLLEPAKQRTPMRIFANSMSDASYEKSSDEQIVKIWAGMALAPWHDFQVLTKRAERMRDWLCDPRTQDLVAAGDRPVGARCRASGMAAFQCLDWRLDRGPGAGG